eukprot:scaffold10_cov257-Pinguiococcus_pyrenoidosus.AAC.30
MRMSYRVRGTPPSNHIRSTTEPELARRLQTSRWPFVLGWRLSGGLKELGTDPQVNGQKREFRTPQRTVSTLQHTESHSRFRTWPTCGIPGPC